MSETENISSFGEALCLTCLTPLNKCDQTAVKCSSVLSAPDRVALVNKVMTACSIKLFIEHEDDKWVCTPCSKNLETLLAFLEQCVRVQAVLHSHATVAEPDVNIKVEDIKQEMDEPEWRPLGPPTADLLPVEKEYASSTESADDIPLSVLKTKTAKKKKKGPKVQLKISGNGTQGEEVCEGCTLVFPTRPELNAHIKANPGTCGHKCFLCSQLFITKKDRKKHHILNHATKHYVCHCGRSYHTKHLLNEHIRTYHEKKFTPIECTICHKFFKTPQSLRGHRRQHLFPRTFPCVSCGKEYKSKLGMDLHYNRIHCGNPMKSFLCDICGKSYRKKERLKLHVLLHHTQNPEKNYKCEHCEKTFLCHDQLANHRRTHSSIRKMLCVRCGRHFRTQSLLNYHFNRIHLNLRPFECSQCGKGFKTRKDLNFHVMIHTGEKPAKCPHCPYTCILLSNLKKHVKNIHNLSSHVNKN